MLGIPSRKRGNLFTMWGVINKTYNPAFSYRHGTFRQESCDEPKAATSLSVQKATKTSSEQKGAVEGVHQNPIMQCRNHYAKFTWTVAPATVFATLGSCPARNWLYNMPVWGRVQRFSLVLSTKRTCLNIRRHHTSWQHCISFMVQLSPLWACFCRLAWWCWLTAFMADFLSQKTCLIQLNSKVRDSPMTESSMTFENPALRLLVSSKSALEGAPVEGQSLPECHLLNLFLDTEKRNIFSKTSVSEWYQSLTAHQHQKGHTVPKQV